MQDTFAKIEQLREQAEGRDPETVRLLDGARDTLKRAMIRENLGKHEGVGMLLAMLERKLDAINGLLSEDEEMTDIKRARYFGEKRAMENVLKFFTIAERNIQVINKDIERRFDENSV